MKLLALFLAASITQAAEHPRLKLWVASIAVMAAGTTADAMTSHGQIEGNPLLATRGTFGAKGITIKAAAVVGMVALQWRSRHNAQAVKASIYTNFATAAMFGAVASINARQQ